MSLDVGGTGAALTVAVLVLNLGCAGFERDPDPAQSARQAIERAEASFRESEALGHAWLPAKRSLVAAREALKEADYPSALAHAEQANALAEASLAQAESEKSAWQSRFPKPR